MKNSRQIPKLIYIYLYFYGRALASCPTRPRRAETRPPEDLDPKKRTPGLAIERGAKRLAKLLESHVSNPDQRPLATSAHVVDDLAARSSLMGPSSSRLRPGMRAPSYTSRSTCGQPGILFLTCDASRASVYCIQEVPKKNMIKKVIKNMIKKKHDKKKARSP